MAVTVPSLYEHYTSGGVNSGLSVADSHFTLNGRNITLYSGAVHYFRVPKEYWRDRLRKVKAAGLNTVETYVPWNLHEPESGTFDFGNGSREMSAFLDIEQFLKIAQEEDLFTIIRPGPYICAEWEFGGLPSWLLREKDVKIRTSDGKFMKFVTRYFAALLQILTLFQFTRGGSIIGFQVENEYGSTEWKKGQRFFKPDKKYVADLRDTFLKNGVKELLFTSDSPLQHGDVGTLPDLFQTANFANNPEAEFDKLKMYQKNKPAMAMEFWTGWFDHWSEQHHTRNNSEFKDVLIRILQYPASVNLYVFHGGTNWGFLNGANAHSGRYQPDTTSYDYDAPLSEAGDYTEKYHIVKEIIQKFNTIDVKLPDLPQETTKKAYPKTRVTKQLKYADFTKQLPHIFNFEKLIPMELLPLNNNSGQSYGYVIYRKHLDSIGPNTTLSIPGHIHDIILVMLNGKLISPPLTSRKNLQEFGYWNLKDGSIKLPEQLDVTLDLIVGNMGRNNFGRLEHFIQFKGLKERVYLNNVELTKWEIMPMEFKRTWLNSLVNWTEFDGESSMVLCKAEINIVQPYDTFLDMREWKMGIVAVNGFVLGRYMHLGPQQTLYLPAPLLKTGVNEIVVFEHFQPAAHLSFSQYPIYLTKN